MGQLRPSPSKEAVLKLPGGAVVYRVREGRAQAVRTDLGVEHNGLVAVGGELGEGDEWWSPTWPAWRTERR